MLIQFKNGEDKIDFVNFSVMLEEVQKKVEHYSQIEEDSSDIPVMKSVVYTTGYDTIRWESRYGYKFIIRTTDGGAELFIDKPDDPGAEYSLLMAAVDQDDMDFERAFVTMAFQAIGQVM